MILATAQVLTDPVCYLLSHKLVSNKALLPSYSALNMGKERNGMGVYKKNRGGALQKSKLAKLEREMQSHEQ